MNNLETISVEKFIEKRGLDEVSDADIIELVKNCSNLRRSELLEVYPLALEYAVFACMLRKKTPETFEALNRHIGLLLEKDPIEVKNYNLVADIIKASPDYFAP